MGNDRGQVRAHLFRVYELVYGEPPAGDGAAQEAIDPYQFDRDVGELVMAIEETFGCSASGQTLGQMIDSLVERWDGTTLVLPD